MLHRAKNKLDKFIKLSKKATYPQLLPHVLKSRLNTYAPFVGAGIRIETLDMDNGLCVINLPMTRLNKYLNGAQFGGSLYMMTDPFLNILLSHKLGKHYLVWDSHAAIEFIKPATSQVTARIKLDTQELSTIMALAKHSDTITRTYTINLTDAQQKLVATVTKTLSITKKS